MRAAKAKGPPCIECLLGPPHSAPDTSAFMLRTAHTITIQTVFGCVTWGRCAKHRDPLANVKAPPKRARRRR